MNIVEYEHIEKYMNQKMEGVNFAHGKEHVHRVLYNALNIMEQTECECDIDILITACLLHDIGRAIQDKNINVCHAKIGSKMAYEYLLLRGWSNVKAGQVSDAILSHRQRKSIKANSIEAKILYDADKLDSLGVIGITRMLMYGGMINEPLYKFNKNGQINITSTKEESSSFFQEFTLKSNVIDSLYFDYTKKIAITRLSNAKKVCQEIIKEINQYSDNSYITKFIK